MGDPCGRPVAGERVRKRGDHKDRGNKCAMLQEIPSQRRPLYCLATGSGFGLSASELR
jgi:hypothetical protein